MTKAYAVKSATDSLAPFEFKRRAMGESDVHIAIMFCGICHSDIHSARNEWGGTTYPFVPGHEIVGKVAQVGSKVTKFKTGDIVGVGCFVGSCRICDACKKGQHSYCANYVATYNGKEKDGSSTKGGYSSDIVVDQDFVLSIPKNLDPAKAAPLLCAGITTYSPLKHWKVGKGKKAGVVGLGGLGHVALKLAKSMGAHTVLFTHSSSKINDAKKLGADEVILSSDQAQMQAHAGTFDFIIDTVSAKHDLNAYLGMLKQDGNLTLVGAPPEPPSIIPFLLIMKRRSLSGSLVGGIPETQEMLEYCATHNVTPEIEIIPIQNVNEAYERVLKSDVKYRFVIDMSSLK